MDIMVKSRAACDRTAISLTKNPTPHSVSWTKGWLGSDHHWGPLQLSQVRILVVKAAQAVLTPSLKSKLAPADFTALTGNFNAYLAWIKGKNIIYIFFEDKDIDNGYKCLMTQELLNKVKPTFRAI